MKHKLILITIGLLLAFVVSAYFLAVGQFTVVNSSTTTPIRFTNTTFQVREATILGRKSARVVNAGDVYIGTLSTDDSQGFVVRPDGEVILRAEGGGGVDLREWYLDVTVANDGLVIIYR